MEKVKKTYMHILKGILMALIITLVIILVFAAIVKLTEMSDGTIHFINQIIKAVSILCGCLFGIREGKAFFKGIIIGTASMLIAYLIFTILAGTSLFTLSVLYELLFGAVCGGICGMIAGLIKKNNI